MCLLVIMQQQGTDCEKQTVSQNQLCPTLRRQKNIFHYFLDRNLAIPGTQAHKPQHLSTMEVLPTLCSASGHKSMPKPQLKTSWSQFYPGLTFLSKFANLWSHTEPNLVSYKTSNKTKSLLLYAGNALGNLDQTPDMKLRTQLQALFLEITICDINLT